MRRAFWADRPANEVALRQNLLLWRRHEPGTSAAILRWNATTSICGLTSLRSQSAGAGRHPNRSVLRLSAQRRIVPALAGLAGARSSHGYWCSGESTILRSRWGEAEAYRRDVPSAEVHVLDAGHFALDTATDEIAAHITTFLKTLKLHQGIDRSLLVQSLWNLRADAIVSAPQPEVTQWKSMSSSTPATPPSSTRPLDKIDIPAWCFSLPDDGVAGCSPAYPRRRARRLRVTAAARPSINVEVLGGCRWWSDCARAESPEKHHLVLDSVSDPVPPAGRRRRSW